MITGITEQDIENAKPLTVKTVMEIYKRHGEVFTPEEAEGVLAFVNNFSQIAVEQVLENARLKPAAGT